MTEIRSTDATLTANEEPTARPEKVQQDEKVFFTYIWGPPGDPAWPLTFAKKAARTIARNSLSEGDIVFTVGTNREPTASQYRKRVLGAYKVSDLEVNTRDYAEVLADRDLELDPATRFPYALHPIAVWEIVDPDNMFSSLVGPLTPSHHLRAQTSVVELDAEVARPLLKLQRRPANMAEPKTLLGRGLVAQKNSKLAPKHEGAFTGQFADHEIWYVYVLALQDNRKRDLAFKIGYAHEPDNRCDAYNSSMAREVTGLVWRVALKQPTSSEDEARSVEQSLLRHFAKHKLASNGEIVSGVMEQTISSELATIMRAI